MVVRKVSASFELVQKIRGTINTRDKFLAERARLADKVWSTMRETDSRECRNCHGFEYMDHQHQSAGAKSVHIDAQNSGQTCIDCHIGIAHELPEQLLQREHARFGSEKVDCRNCHTSMAQKIPEGDPMWEW